MSGADDRFVIRARRASDADGLAQLVNLPGYRYGTMRVPFHSVDEVANWIQNTPSSNLELVAAIEDQIIGQAGLRRLSGRQHHSAYLGMGVHDDWVRRGVGTALMMALLDAADNWRGIRRCGGRCAVAIRIGCAGTRPPRGGSACWWAFS